MLPHCLQHSFKPYQSLFHGWKYTKSSYYNSQLYDYFREYPAATTQHAKIVFQNSRSNYIQSIINDSACPWNDKSFGEISSKIRKDITIGNRMDTLKRLVFNDRNINKMLVHMDNLFDSITDEEMMIFLNRYSKSHNYDMSWGLYIEAMNCVKWVIRSLTKKYKYKVAQKQKQSILSSMIKLGNDQNLENKSILYEITDGRINSDLIDKLKKFRWQFDNDEELYLYDRKFDNKYKTFDKVSITFKKSMRQFWINETVPSPIARNSLILDHTTRDINDNRIRHQKHRLRGTILDFFDDYKIKVGNQLSETNNEPVPDYNSFYAQMPSFIRVDGKIDYNLCKKCFNFDQAFGAFKRTLFKIHNHHCTDNCPIVCRIKCNCAEFAAVMNGQMFELSDHAFTLKTLCDISKPSPNLKCALYNCNCGHNWLYKFECKMNDDLMVEYKRIECDRIDI